MNPCSAGMQGNQISLRIDKVQWDAKDPLSFPIRDFVLTNRFYKPVHRGINKQDSFDRMLKSISN